VSWQTKEEVVKIEMMIVESCSWQPTVFWAHGRSGGHHSDLHPLVAGTSGVNDWGSIQKRRVNIGGYKLMM